VADIIQRPLFFEGQILAARDLSSAVDYARGRAQRHDSLLHTGGVVDGLQLSKVELQAADGSRYAEVTLTSGVAIDPTGREIVVADDRRLDTELFGESNVAADQADAWYPVVLRHREQAAAAAETMASCSTGSAPATRMSEGGIEEFRRPGGAVDLGADDPGVLVGFVRWDKDHDKFTDVGASDGTLRVRYVGVRADSVEAQGGRVELRTAAVDQPGAAALQLSDEELTFGLQDGSGGLSKLFTVNKKGEVTAGGKPLGGGVRVESGIVSHLMRIPLPANVTEDAVADGSVVLHLQVQPLWQLPPGTSFDQMIPLECYVDDERRLHCRVLLKDSAANIEEERPYVASYTAIGFSPEPS
jgi:hypothetical protein